MTRYSDVEDGILIAAYQISSAEPELKLTLDTLLDQHPIDAPQRWIAEALRNLSDKGQIAASNSSGPGRRVRITGDGLRRAEQLLDARSKVPAGDVFDGGLDDGDDLPILDGGLAPPAGMTYVTTEAGEYVTNEDDEYVTVDDLQPIDREKILAVSSADWTGIAERLQSNPVVVDQIASYIRQIDILVDQTGLTNTEKQKAKAITDSLGKLIASPEPEWRAIATLLTSPSLTAILNVAAIVQIVLKLFGIG